MNLRRLILLGIALFFIIFSWIGVFWARSGLIVRSLHSEEVPLLFVAPQGKEQVPGVLVAHGFTGSKQLMLGYAHALAHAGYGVMLWDFAGHGANPTPLVWDSLEKDFEVAQRVLLEQPEVDTSRLALLGHSMGSGVVMSAGIGNPERFAATIAISPTGAEVTPQLPRNLQLQAGSWEESFIENAQGILVEAGGENSNLAAGEGRSLVIIPNAEHITILFRNATYDAAREWLNATFGISDNSTYRDRRMVWYGLHLLGWLLLLGAIAPSLVSTVKDSKVKIPSLRRWGGLFLSPIAAVTLLWLLASVIEIQNLGGLMVGGSVGLWFFLAGIVWLGVLWRLPRLTLKALWLGILLFVLLWVAFGGMAQFVWLQWWLIPTRLQLWLLLSVACFPWFFASGIVQQGISVGKRLLWWLGQSIVLVLGFFAAVQFIPQLSFMFILLPLFPPLMGIFSFAASQLKEAWSYALGTSLFFGWILAAAFPLAL